MVFCENRYLWRSRYWLNNILSKFLCRKASLGLLFVTSDCGYPREIEYAHVPIGCALTTLGGAHYRITGLWFLHGAMSKSIPSWLSVRVFMWCKPHSVDSHIYVLYLFPHRFSWIFPCPGSPLCLLHGFHNPLVLASLSKSPRPLLFWT